MENELVASVASGIPVTQDAIARPIRILNIDVSAPWFAIALLSEATDDGAQLDLQRLRRRLAAKLQPVASSVLFGDVGKMTIGLISPRGDAARTIKVLSSALDTFDRDARIVCGVGEVTGELARAQDSCSQAGDSARAALIAGDGTSIVTYKEALLEVILSGRPAAADALVASRLAPLFNHPHLLETLGTLLDEDLSQSRAARRMFVHVNTMGHRVKRITEITGYDPTRTADVVEMALALRWANMTGAAALSGVEPTAHRRTSE